MQRLYRFQFFFLYFKDFRIASKSLNTLNSCMTYRIHFLIYLSLSLPQVLFRLRVPLPQSTEQDVHELQSLQLKKVSFVLLVHKVKFYYVIYIIVLLSKLDGIVNIVFVSYRIKLNHKTNSYSWYCPNDDFRTTQVTGQDLRSVKSKHNDELMLIAGI